MRRVLSRSIVFVALAIASLGAQSPAGRAPQMPGADPKLFQGLRYRLVGPSRGGRVTTVTGVPSRAAHVLYGRRERRRVSHHRRRRDVDADHRWQSPARIDGLDRGR